MQQQQVTYQLTLECYAGDEIPSFGEMEGVVLGQGL